MKKPVHILLPEESIDGLHYGTRLPRNSAYQLLDTHVHHWQYPDFSLSEQYYDAKDAFICLAELYCQKPVDIGIACRADIFWLYQLEGSYDIVDPANDLDTVLRTEPQCYTQVYVPQQSYVCRFPKGHHLLFYFVFQPKWLRRQGVRAMEGFHHLLASQQEQHKEVLHNTLMPIHGRIYQQLLSLFTLPKMKSLLKEIKIYEHCFNLLDLSQEDLHFFGEQEVEGEHVSAAIRRYITQQIPKGALPSIPAIAVFFKIKYSTLRKEHKEIYGYTLQQYVHRKKMELAAHYLVSEDIPISEITYRLNYADTQSFYKQFLKYYGIPPTTYRLRYKK